MWQSNLLFIVRNWYILKIVMDYFLKMITKAFYKTLHELDGDPNKCMV